MAISALVWPDVNPLALVRPVITSNALTGVAGVLVLVPRIRAPPFTSSFDKGLVVPWPTLPFERKVITIFEVISNPACAREISKRVLELLLLFSQRLILKVAPAP